MKFLFSLLLFFALLLPACAFSESAPQTFDFGEFTMDIAPDTPGSVRDKTDGAEFVLLYPAYQADPSALCVFSVAWKSAETDLSTAQSRSNAIQQLSKEALSAQGGEVHFQMRLADRMRVGGRDALMALMAFKDASHPESPALLQFAVLVPVSNGTYYFCGFTADSSHVDRYFMPLLQTVRWKEASDLSTGRQIVDTGDFLLRIPEGEPCKLSQKAHGQLLLSVYPAFSAGDETTRLQVLWLDAYENLALLDQDSLNAYLAVFKQNMSALSPEDGAAAPDRVSVSGRKSALVGGVQGVMLTCSSISDKSAQPLRVLFVTGDSGTYCFICTALDENAYSQYLKPILESVEWK